jgi:hypothetical protein
MLNKSPSPIFQARPRPSLNEIKNLYAMTRVASTIINSLQRPIIKTKLCSGNGTAHPKLDRLVTKTFFIRHKRASFGWALQVSEKSFVLRTGL